MPLPNSRLLGSTYPQVDRVVRRNIWAPEAFRQHYRASAVTQQGVIRSVFLGNRRSTGIVWLMWGQVRRIGYILAIAGVLGGGGDLGPGMMMKQSTGRLLFLCLCLCTYFCEGSW